jgi:hypothetical protein
MKAAATVGPPSTHQAGDAAPGQRLEHSFEVEAAVLAVDAEHLDALGLQDVFGDGRRIRAS